MEEIIILVISSSRYFLLKPIFLLKNSYIALVNRKLFICLALFGFY